MRGTSRAGGGGGSEGHEQGQGAVGGVRSTRRARRVVGGSEGPFILITHLEVLSEFVIFFFLRENQDPC